MQLTATSHCQLSGQYVIIQFLLIVIENEIDFNFNVLSGWCVRAHCTSTEPPRNPFFFAARLFLWVQQATVPTTFERPLSSMVALDSTMHPIIAASIALALASVIAAEDGVPACNSLQPVKIDIQWLIRSSPLTIYRSNWPINDCGLTAFVGPAGDSTSYTGTVIVIRGNYTFSYDFDLINNSLFKTALCSNGIKKDFQTVYVNSISPSASVCVVSCNDKDATLYDAIICCGRTSDDERDIDKFLETNLNGVKGITNSQSCCPKPQHCDTFTN